MPISENALASGSSRQTGRYRVPADICISASRLIIVRRQNPETPELKPAPREVFLTESGFRL